MHKFTILALFLISGAAYATPPLRDSLEFQSQITPMFPSTGSWLELPASAKLEEMRRAEEGCSAIGGPVGRWRVIDNRLWLSSLSRCRGDVELSAVYGGSNEPILAVWVSAELITFGGKPLCVGPYFTFWEKTIKLKVEQGVVKSVVETNNENDPQVPKSKSAEGIVPCLPARR